MLYETWNRVPSSPAENVSVVDSNSFIVVHIFALGVRTPLQHIRNGSRRSSDGNTPRKRAKRHPGMVLRKGVPNGLAYVMVRWLPTAYERGHEAFGAENVQAHFKPGKHVRARRSVVLNHYVPISTFLIRRPALSTDLPALSGVR